MKVKKRNGDIVPFNKQKIIDAINKAFIEVDGQLYETDTAEDIALEIEKEVINYFAHVYNAINEQDKVDKLNRIMTVEQIQDMIEDALMRSERRDVARAYIRYRYKREMSRNTTDKSVLELMGGTNDYWNTENSNKNAKLVTTQRDYLAGIVSTDISERYLLPKEVVKAHKSGIIHQHDMDYMAQTALHNCCLINLEDMLQNGTVINNVMIESPKRLITATTIATQIITAVASSQYGGTTISLSHLAPFVRKSKNYHFEKYLKRGFSKEESLKNAELDTEKEISDAVQTFNYQINSMSTTNGQAPFVSVFMWIDENLDYQLETAMLIEEFLKQRIQGLKNKQGVYVTPAFPKLLYVTDDNNITEESPYWYLTTLAAECTAKRMVPDYISAKKMREYKINALGAGDVYPCMGCRSFLTPDRNFANLAKAKNFSMEKGKYYGRFNMGVTTINLVDAALSANKDMNKFWELLEERCELCHLGLRTRIDRLLSVTSDVAPILWQHGALARLDEGEKLTNLIYNGYSTASLGYAGLWECVYALTDKKLTEPEGEKLGLQILQKLNDFCNKWKKAENIDYSLYGTPIESTTYKFAKNLQARFGIIKGVTDKKYITNSYHVHVTEPIDAFSKLNLESRFQKLSPGGAISYIEVPNMSNNIPAVLQIIQYIHDNIMYAELNTKSDYCQQCGYTGEIQIVEENNNLVWECPNCGNRDTSKLNVARRTCGYIGANFWNQGRTWEIKERQLHL